MKVCIGNEELINEYIDGRLTPEQEEELRKHMESCPACREYYEELCFLSDEMVNVEFPKDLHSSIMAAVEKEAGGRSKIARFFRPKRIGLIAAMLTVALIGAAGMRLGAVRMGSSGDNGRSADGVKSTETQLAGVSEAVSDEIMGRSAEPAEKNAALDNGRSQLESGLNIVPQTHSIEMQMKSWFEDYEAPTNFMVISNDVSEDGGSGEEIEGSDDPAGGDAYASGRSAGDMDARMTELASRLDNIGGYGFYVIAYGSVEQLPEIFADRAEGVEPGADLLINVKNDLTVMQEIETSMGESGFEVYGDAQGLYFSSDAEAREGLVIIEFSE